MFASADYTNKTNNPSRHSMHGQCAMYTESLMHIKSLCIGTHCGWACKLSPVKCEVSAHGPYENFADITHRDLYCCPAGSSVLSIQQGDQISFVGWQHRDCWNCESRHSAIKRSTKQISRDDFAVNTINVCKRRVSRFLPISLLLIANLRIYCHGHEKKASSAPGPHHKW